MAVIDQPHQPDAQGQGHSNATSQGEVTLHADLDIAQFAPDIPSEARSTCQHGHEGEDQGGDSAHAIFAVDGRRRAPGCPAQGYHL